MRQGIPTTYRVFRWSWSALHLALVVAVLTGFLVWALTDDRAGHALTAWLDGIGRLQNTLGNLLPYPWDVLGHPRG